MTGGSFLVDVTPVILTFNEEANIGRVLDKLAWARQVVVVDSGSTDETLAIIQRYRNVNCVHRRFDTHAQQWEFALHETGITTAWVLAMDADYLLTDELVSEIDVLRPDSGVAGYVTRFKYCIHGRPLRGTLYPPVVTLYRRRSAHYFQAGHTQRVQIDGRVESLRGFILHDDRKPLTRWLWAQDRYATLEAATLQATAWGSLRLQDKLRRMVVIAPLLVPFYCLFVRGNVLDGWRGVYYAVQRATAEAVISLKIIESRFQ